MVQYRLVRSFAQYTLALLRPCNLQTALFELLAVQNQQKGHMEKVLEPQKLPLLYDHQALQHFLRRPICLTEHSHQLDPYSN